jgi:general secretion pathway protein L
MRGRRSRLALVLLGDRLVAAWLHHDRTEIFSVDAEEPSAALRAELDARRIAARAVALGLSRATVSVKPIELPRAGREMREMVRFELERHLPFPSDDAPFDFLPLPGGSPAAGPSAPVLVLAADRRVVEGAIRIAQEAKLRPRSVTVAAHDLLALVRPTRAQPVVWTHRTGNATDLLLLLGPRLVLSRRVVSTDDAVILDEIRRSFSVARWRGCEALWVSGDTGAPATGSPLTELGVPISEPPYTREARRRLASVEDNARGAAALAIAVALGRRGRPLDLIPPSLRPRRLTREQGATLGVLAVTILLSLAALLVPGYVEQRRLDAVNATIGRLDGEVRAVERTVRDLDRKRKLLAAIEALPASGLRPLPLLREVTDLLPADAWLTTLSLESKGLEMTGQAATASALIPLLEDSPRFQRVEFASPVTRGRDKEQFRIQAAWEARPGQPIAAGPATAPAAAAPAREPSGPRRPVPGPSRPPEPGR